MKTAMELKPKTRVVLIAALGVFAVALFFYTRDPGDGVTAQRLAEPTGALQAGPPARETMSLPSASPMVPQEPNPDDPNLPVIDEVMVDKTEVCRGEENFVTVKAHTGNGTDAFLTTTMRDPRSGRWVMGDGRVGRIPFRLDEPITRPIDIIVEGNMVSKVVTMPPIHVKDCVAPRQVIVHVQRTMAAMDRVGLTAELVENQPSNANEPFQPFVPASFEWDFGDGQRQITSSAGADHSYEARDQNTRQSAFMVTVSIKDQDGRAASGSATIVFANGAFGRLRFKNEVVISIGVKEADPTRNEHEKIWLYHGYDKPVRIESATLIELVRENGQMRETLRRSYTPEELLGLSELPPRQSSTIRDLTELQPVAPEAVRHIELSGTTADGKAAAGAFSLLPAKHAAAETTTAAILP